jgi:hypothetical protein
LIGAHEQHPAQQMSFLVAFHADQRVLFVTMHDLIATPILTEEFRLSRTGGQGFFAVDLVGAVAKLMRLTCATQ